MLTKKTNWIMEFAVVKKMMKKFIDMYDTRCAKYVNIKKTWKILHNNKLFTLKNQKSRFFYEILIDKKCVRNYMENVWEREFNLENYNWEEIYKRNVWNLSDKKLSEFKYKILNNILSNRSMISKWNKNINNKCPICGINQTMKHLLFDCHRIQTVWNLISSILKVTIRYKHIVIGNREEVNFIKARNLLIFYISYSIYKFWVQSENNIVNFIEANIIEFIKRDIFSRTIYVKDKMFIQLCDKLITKM